MKAFLTLFLTVSTAFAAEQADVVVVAATPGGIAAAVSAAHSGASVILLEEKAHVGGIVSAGLTNTDIYRKAAVGGLFAEFVKRVREHYVKTYGENSEQVKACQGGHMFEAKVAGRVFRDLLAGEKNIRLIERQRVISARVVGADGTEREADLDSDQIVLEAAGQRLEMKLKRRLQQITHVGYSSLNAITDFSKWEQQ
jgi:NADPH-dependent 2,4-dienoyl-CoA reductase/sulfur reductase-like enzyme